MTTTRNTTYLDKLNLAGNCPGFNLFEVKVWENDDVFLMASDHESGLSTRLFFRSNQTLTLKSATLLGRNPDVTSWDRTHA